MKKNKKRSSSSSSNKEREEYKIDYLDIIIDEDIDSALEPQNYGMLKVMIGSQE